MIEKILVIVFLVSLICSVGGFILDIILDNCLFLVIPVSIMMASVLGICFIDGKNESYRIESRWNNGKCTVCKQGTYHLLSTAGHRHDTDYIYVCDNCEHTEIFNEAMR